EGKGGERGGDGKHGGRAYADRHVIAAYTDRPTYRPGQPVQGKVIVRRLAPLADADTPPGFRAEEFDVASRLTVPEKTGRIRYVVIDPRGRQVADGMLELNDFGTAAWSAVTDAEAVVGAYSLRLSIREHDYHVPEVFAVKYDRRPELELELTGLPERAEPGAKLRIEVEGRYTFGKPVSVGRIDLRLGNDIRHPLWSHELKLDDAGRGV